MECLIKLYLNAKLSIMNGFYFKSNNGLLDIEVCM